MSASRGRGRAGGKTLLAYRVSWKSCQHVARGLLHAYSYDRVAASSVTERQRPSKRRQRTLSTPLGRGPLRMNRLCRVFSTLSQHERG